MFPGFGGSSAPAMPPRSPIPSPPLGDDVSDLPLNDPLPFEKPIRREEAPKEEPHRGGVPEVAASNEAPSIV
eukprot:gene38273-43351_t